jgi:hypothetical protein
MALESGQRRSHARESGQGDVDRNYSGERVTHRHDGEQRDIDRVDPAARLAGRQRGIATRRQLRAAGLSDDAIDYRLETGRLHVVHRGVYLVGHPIFPPLAREVAALLAGGPRAVLSHRTAAVTWRILDERSDLVDVTVVGRRGRQRAGIRLHSTVGLQRREVRISNGMPVTAPARTLLDLGTVLTGRGLVRAVDEARALRLVGDADLRSLLARFPRRRGTCALRALLEAEREPELTRSEAEERMLGLIDRGGLPRPLVNARVAGHEVDLYWPDRGLVVEVDGYAFHSRPGDFERDHRREQDLSAVGIRISRVTYRQISGEPAEVLVRLTRALFTSSKAGAGLRRLPESSQDVVANDA